MLTVSLPWPPSATSANASSPGNWRKKTDAARSYKRDCAWLIRAAKIKPCGFSPIFVTVTFNPPSRTSRYDMDNLLGRAKQGLDALAEAIGVDDALWREMRLRRGTKAGLGLSLSLSPRGLAMLWQSSSGAQYRDQRKAPEPVKAGGLFLPG